MAKKARPIKDSRDGGAELKCAAPVMSYLNSEFILLGITEKQGLRAELAKKTLQLFLLRCQKIPSVIQAARSVLKSFEPQHVSANAIILL